MGFIKKKFRSIKKLPDCFFVPIVLLVKMAKLLMRTEFVDPLKHIEISMFPYISVTWHNRLLFFPVMFPRKIRERTAAIISPSRDGQYVTDLVRLFGVTPIRGSTSKRGAMALNESIEWLSKGYNVSITPDGPRGPRYCMSKGPVILASKTGFPVLPISVNYTSYWQTKSWDGFRIPKPWSKVSLVIGEPTNIPPDLDEEQIEYWRKMIEKKLMELSID